MKNNMQMKYIGYARKSSEDNKERQAASLPDQIFKLEEMKKSGGLKFVDTLQESKTAHKPGREVFNKMVERIIAGEANAIATWHANRLTRNPVDAGQLVYLMDEKKLLEVRTPEKVFSCENTTDKFMLWLDFGISKKDSDDKSVVVSRGLEKNVETVGDLAGHPLVI